MKIVTKAQADKVLVESLFKPVNGRTLNRMKFDNGKYKPDAQFVGREVQAGSGIFAVYPIHLKDADGPYTALYCICV